MTVLHVDIDIWHVNIIVLHAERRSMPLYNSRNKLIWHCWRIWGLILWLISIGESGLISTEMHFWSCLFFMTDDYDYWFVIRYLVLVHVKALQRLWCKKCIFFYQCFYIYLVHTLQWYVTPQSNDYYSYEEHHALINA